MPSRDLIEGCSTTGKQGFRVGVYNCLWHKAIYETTQALGTAQFQPRLQALGHQLSSSWVIPWCYAGSDPENLGASGT